MITLQDKTSFKVKQLVIGENCGCHTELPEGMTPREATTSRLLDGLNKANITNRTKKKVAVLYGNKNSCEGELNV